MELQTCNIGGLFLALYREKIRIDEIISNLEKDLSDFFIFRLHINEHKIDFPTFFQNTFSQLGTRSNIFHLLDFETLTDELKLNFLNYLQYTRERFKNNPYSIVFWISPQTEKNFFHSAPDFHNWVFGTYDFSTFNSIDQTNLTSNNLIEDIPIDRISYFFEKVISELLT